MSTYNKRMMRLTRSYKRHKALQAEARAELMAHYTFFEGHAKPGTSQIRKDLRAAMKAHAAQAAEVMAAMKALKQQGEQPSPPYSQV